jgi:NADH-quinone oxidoreductase subunit A
MLLTIGIVLILLMSISFLLSNSVQGLSKLSGYECGLEPISDAKVKLKIVYYVVGVLYLLFDLEIVFLYPLASSLWLINNYFGLGAIILFILTLTLTFIYEWFIGALELN